MNLPLLEPCQHVLPAQEFGKKSQLLEELGQGIEPVAVMMTYWELGFAPDQLSHTNPGEIMVIQNPGGLVPAASMTDEQPFLGSVTDTLNYPTVRHLIVCGHTECKTLGLLVSDNTDEKKNPFRMLLDSVAERFRATYRERPAQDWLGLVVQETILQQLANLRSHSHIQSRLQKGELVLHGWIRDDQTSAITAYDPASGQFND